VRVACDRDWHPVEPPVITVPVTIKPARIVWGFQQADGGDPGWTTRAVEA
jgi:hypothetical protein